MDLNSILDHPNHGITANDFFMELKNLNTLLKDIQMNLKLLTHALIENKPVIIDSVDSDSRDDKKSISSDDIVILGAESFPSSTEIISDEKQMQTSCQPNKNCLFSYWEQMFEKNQVQEVIEKMSTKFSLEDNKKMNILKYDKKIDLNFWLVR